MIWNEKIQLGDVECSRVQLSWCRCKALKSCMELILSQMYGQVSNCFAAPFTLIARCGSQLSTVFVLLLRIHWNWPLEGKDSSRNLFQLKYSSPHCRDHCPKGINGRKVKCVSSLYAIFVVGNHSQGKRLLYKNSILIPLISTAVETVLFWRLCRDTLLITQWKWALFGWVRRQSFSFWCQECNIFLILVLWTSLESLCGSWLSVGIDKLEQIIYQCH